MVSEGPDAASNVRSALEDAIGAAIRNIGPRKVLSLLPITAEVDERVEVRGFPDSLVFLIRIFDSVKLSIVGALTRIFHVF